MDVEYWEIIDTGSKSAQENMLFDAQLLEKAHCYKRPVLHFYEWEKPSATYGHFIQPAAVFDLARVEEKGLCLVQRPTGGGIIFHIWDMAFSLLVPADQPEFSINTLDNYAFVNNAVLHAIDAFMQSNSALSLIEQDTAALDEMCKYFCMVKPTKYDVLWGGKKVAGAAQRRTKLGFLHQGSISLTAPISAYLQEVLLPNTAVVQAMQKFTYPLLREDACKAEVLEAKKQLKVLLATHLNNASLKCRG